MTPEKKPCSKRVHGQARRDVLGHNCQRRGVVERDGKWWCKIHDPLAVKARNRASRAKWDAQYESNKANAERRDAIAAAKNAVIEAAKNWSASRAHLVHTRTLLAAVGALLELEGKQPA